MPSSSPLPNLRSVCEQQGYPLTDAQVEQFLAFGAALEKWNQFKNLTRVPPDEFDSRHFAESCLLLDLIPPGASVLDIGTGPGLPAWPIACARPDCQVTAIDSNGKMLEFLRTQGLPNLKIVHGRMEEQPWLEEFDVVSGRAVAPLSTQMELSAKSCKRGGVIIPFRSPSDTLEGQFLSILGLSLKMARSEAFIETRVITLPIYLKVVATPQQYPRPWAKMKSKPLE